MRVGVILMVMTASMLIAGEPIIVPITPITTVNTLNPFDAALEGLVTGLRRPVGMAAIPGDPDRLLVIEQHTGNVLIIFPRGRAVASNPFLTVPDLTLGQEQGLLGIAVDPGFATNGYIYVNRTVAGDSAGATQVVRFRADAVTPGAYQGAETADVLTATVLLTIPQPQPNHNGGWMAFGPDGYLYVATGDGGGGGDPHGLIGNAQDRTSLLGKILRLDVHRSDPPRYPYYAIPADNPFRGNSQGWREEILHFGLRNPWRCSFDRTTGDLWIGDVGQGMTEEIDRVPMGVAGLNFGWRAREGNAPYTNETPVTTATEPVHTYYHGYSQAAVIGGCRYRGSLPALRGRYLFADYFSYFWSGNWNGTALDDVQVHETGWNWPWVGGRGYSSLPTSFAEDLDGEVYVLFMGGMVARIVSAGVPQITTTDLPPFQMGQLSSVPLAAAGGTPPLSWSVVWGALPAGLALAGDGALAGIPASSGITQFTIEVRDAVGRSTSRDLRAVAYEPLVIDTAGTLPSALLAETYSQRLVARSGADPLLWTIVSGALPVGLALDPGTGVIRGVPLESGSTPVAIQVQDALGHVATKSFTLTVDGVIGILPLSTTSWTVDQPLSQDLGGVGGVGPYMWSIAGGALPAGLLLSTGGSLTGMPTSIGTDGCILQVVDANGAMATRAVGWLIAERPEITTDALPPHYVGGYAWFQLDVVGGTAPFAWRMLAGKLPFGVGLDPATGVIFGDPYYGESTSFEIAVTDAAGAESNRQLVFQSIQSPTFPNNEPPPALVGLQWNFQTYALCSPASTYSLLEAPAGMTIDPMTGVLSWLPSEAGTFTAIVQAVNGIWPDGQLRLVISVSAYGVPVRPASPPWLGLPSTEPDALPTLLSATGLFTDTVQLVPRSALVPYVVNTPVWADGAMMQRWAAIPDGATIPFSTGGQWQFPAGSVFVQQIDINTDERVPGLRQRLETRILVKTFAGAYGATYRWNTEQTDATLVASRSSEELTIIGADGATRSQRWSYLTGTDCLQCHNAYARHILGVNTRQINRLYTYPVTGVSDNQLRTWEHLGWFGGALPGQPSTFTRLVAVGDTTASLELRVRSYLDANCSHCHSPGATLAYFDARFDQPLSGERIIGGSVNNDLGIAGAVVVAPGSTERSVMHRRMSSLVTGVRMPPIGSEQVDDHAVAVLDAWIRNLSADSGGRVGAETATVSDGGKACAAGSLASLGALLALGLVRRRLRRR